MRKIANTARRVRQAHQNRDVSNYHTYLGRKEGNRNG